MKRRSLAGTSISILFLFFLFPLSAPDATERATGAAALSFDACVRAQEAIERVYWRHRTWPADNAGARPPFDDVLPEARLRAKVESYLKKSPRAVRCARGRSSPRGRVPRPARAERSLDPDVVRA